MNSNLNCASFAIASTFKIHDFILLPVPLYQIVYLHTFCSTFTAMLMLLAAAVLKLLSALAKHVVAHSCYAMTLPCGAHGDDDGAEHTAGLSLTAHSCRRPDSLR